MISERKFPLPIPPQVNPVVPSFVRALDGYFSMSTSFTSGEWDLPCRNCTFGPIMIICLMGIFVYKATVSRVRSCPCRRHTTLVNIISPCVPIELSHWIREVCLGDFLYDNFTIRTFAAFFSGLVYSSYASSFVLSFSKQGICWTTGWEADYSNANRRLLVFYGRFWGIIMFLGIALLPGWMITD